jgi:hypothetical protein
VSLTSAVARDALEGKLPRTLQWSVTPSEYALFNICHALDDMAKALAYFNMPNQKLTLDAPSASVRSEETP